VKGSAWKETREARAAAKGVTTAAGTWAYDEAEARAIEAAADADEAWDKALAAKEEWTNKPVQPPGLGRCGARGGGRARRGGCRCWLAFGMRGRPPSRPRPNPTRVSRHLNTPTPTPHPPHTHPTPGPASWRWR
jgi:hypothetical protein